MPLPKKVSKINLARSYAYLGEDTSPFSDGLFNIVDFPDRLTSGKNLFKLRANNDVLVNNSPIHIEILDFNGNPIYYEVLNYIEKDGTRVIAVYIFPDTSPGKATVYLAGRARFVGGRGIPFSQDLNSPDHISIPNILWSRSVPVAPTSANDSEIIFTTQPSMTITEVVQPYLQPVNIQNVFTQQTSSLAGATLLVQPQPTSISAVPSTSTAEGGLTAASPNFGTQFFDTSKLESSLINSSGDQMDSPPLNTLSGFSKLTTTNFPLNQNMIGGVLTIKDPIITAPNKTGRNANNLVIPATQTFSEWNNNSPDSTTSQQLSGSIKFAITDVLTSTTARVAQYDGFKNEADNTFGPFAITVGTGDATFGLKGSSISQPGTAVLNTIDSATNFTASYIKATDVIYTENSSSFADIILANTEPATGDVYRIKTLYKPSGFFGDFLDLGDTILERQNILIDTASLETNVAVGTAYERFGNFESLQEIQTYWTSGSVGNANETTFAYNEDTLIGGAEITPTWSPNQYTASVDNATVFSIKPKYQQLVYKDTTYIVKFQVALPSDIGLYSSADPNLTNNRIDVYISGSAVDIDQTLSNVSIGEINPEPNTAATLLGNFKNGGPLGHRIGSIRCKNIPQVTANIQLQFKAKSTAPFDIKFVTRRGSWIVGEVEIEADKQTGFSPNYVRIFKRIPTEHLKTPLTFKFQYYDFRGNKADLETIAYGAIFNGGNTYIDGTENLITGSVFIGNSIGSGIELAGVSSGYVKSVGYDGFTSASLGKGPGGFLMWSGSGALIVGADTYEGVGLELIANSGSYFRYRTNPSELDIRTETFFLGSDSQFISGANGNIEISSSNFHLTPAGDVTMSGTISATAGNIGDFQIIDGKISGSNITLDAIRSQIYKTDQGPGSDTGAAFDKLRDEYYIDFTPSGSNDPIGTNYYIKMGPNFMVDKDGILIASGAQFIGTITASAGLIGGFTIGSSSLFSDNIFISGSPAVGGVDSPEYMFISTSNFNVKQNGDITGSSVLFDGGTIAGWEVTPTYLRNYLGGNVNKRLYVSVESDEQNGNFQEGLQIYKNDVVVNPGEVKVVRVGGLSDTTNLHAVNDYGIQVIKRGPVSGYTNILYIGAATQSISGWDIETGSLKQGTNIQLDSANKSISINDQTFGNTGIQLQYNSGTPRAFIGKSDGGFIKFTGTDLEMSSSKFFLGSDSQFISGANGNIEISSSNFHLTPEGNVTMSGEINAAAGTIGSIVLNGSAGSINSGDAFIDTVNASELDTKLWTHIRQDGNETVDIVNGALRMTNFDVSWDHAIVGKKSFARANSPTFVYHFKILEKGGAESAPRVMFGVTDNTGSSAYSYTNNVHAIFFNGGTAGITVYEGANNLGSLAGSTTAVGDTFKVIIQPDITAGFDYTIYKNDNYTTAFLSGTIGSSTGSGLYPAIYSLGTSQQWELYSAYAYDSTSAGAFDIKGGGSYGFINNSGSEMIFSQGGFTLRSPNIDLTSDSIRLGSSFLFDATQLSIETPKFFLGSNSQFISGANGNIEISSSNFHLQPDGDVIMSGTITATAGNIGGFAITSNAISSSNGDLQLKSNGQITGSNVLFDGGVIGGFTIDSDHIADAAGNLQLTGSTGTIKAVQGEIGGFTLSSTTITGENIVIDSAGSISTADYASDVKGWSISAINNGFAEFENAKIRGTLATAVFEKETVNAVGGQLYIANSTTLTASADNPNGNYASTDTTMSVVNVGGFVAGEILSAKKINTTGFTTEYLLVNSASRNDASSNTDFSGKLFVTRAYGSGVSGNSASLGDSPSTAVAYSGSQVLVSTGKVGTGFIRLNANPNNLATPYIDIVERTGSGIYDIELKARLGDLSGITDPAFTDNVTGYGLYTGNGYFKGKIEVASLPQAPSADKLRGYWPLDTLNFIDASGLNSGSAKSYSGTPVIVSGSNGHPAGYGVKATTFGAGHDILIPDNSNELLQCLTSGQYTICWYQTVQNSLFNYAKVLDWDVRTTGTFGTPDDSFVRWEHTADFGSSTPDYQFVYRYQTAAGPTYGYVSTTTASTGSLTPGQTYFFTVVMDQANTSLKLYINTELVNEQNNFGSLTTFEPHPDNALNLRLFRDNVPNEVLSEFRVYTGSLSVSEIQSIYLGNTQQGGGRTVIEGGQITTGRIQSTNFSTTEGSEFNLDDGTFTLGGSASPKLSFDGSTLAVDGTITANDGTIGGFTISANSISSSNGDLQLKSNGQITGSNVLFNGGVIAGWAFDSTKLSNGTDIQLDSANKSITIANQTFGQTGVQLEYNSGTPRAFIGKNGGGFVKFTGTDLEISSSAFFLGSATQFISGSSGNIEISSSNFHLQPDGDVIMSGTVTATAGQIGGFAITSNAISSSNGDLQLKSNGQITGSNVLFSGGEIGGFDLSSTQINSTNNNLILKDSGQITGSNVLFDGGVIGGFELGANVISSSNGDLVLTSGGQITGSNVLFDGGAIGGFTIDGHSLMTTGVEINDATQTLFISSSDYKVTHTGNLTASNALFDNNVTAVNFTRRGVLMDQADSSSYWDTQSAPGVSPKRVKLVFDGSLGGDKISELTFGIGTENVVIVGITALNDPTGAGGTNEVRLFISQNWTGTVQYDDTQVYSDYNQLPGVI